MVSAVYSELELVWYKVYMKWSHVRSYISIHLL